MSRTYKLHRHKAHRDTRYEKQNQSRKTNLRMLIKTILKKSKDYEEGSFPDEKSMVSKKTSSGYLSPLETEKKLIKKSLAMKKDVMNGFPIRRWWVFTRMDKILIQAAIQKDTSFKGFTDSKDLERDYYFQRAFEILSEEELKECVHKYFASKGGKK
jgi:hypothetical protein